MALAVQRALYFSWMSQASYRDFTGLLSTSPTTDIRARLVDPNRLSPQNRFAQVQADSLLGLDALSGAADGFKFVSHQPSGTGGFSATVFKANGANEYTIAVRGTEPSSPFSDILKADILGIALKGRASEQLISAYRYYKQLVTAPGRQVSYSSAEISKLEAIYNDFLLSLLIPISESDRKARVAAFKSDLQASSQQLNVGLGEIAAGAVINFAGHSLGGHVSTLLAAMVQQFG